MEEQPPQDDDPNSSDLSPMDDTLFSPGARGFPFFGSIDLP
jgi:hypothetical protein